MCVCLVRGVVQVPYVGGHLLADVGGDLVHVDPAKALAALLFLWATDAEKEQGGVRMGRGCKVMQEKEMLVETVNGGGREVESVWESCVR